MEDKDGGIEPPRLLILVGEVDWDMVEKAAEAMAVFNTLSRSQIAVHITSPGGGLDPAMAIYDLLRLSTAPVATCVFGCAGSSASIIAQAGSRRYMAPNANMMIHCGSLGLQGRFGEKDFAKLKRDAAKNDEFVFRLYARHTGSPIGKIREWCEAETEMTAKQALKRGFVDAIIKQPRKR